MVRFLHKRSQKKLDFMDYIVIIVALKQFMFFKRPAIQILAYCNSIKNLGFILVVPIVDHLKIDGNSRIKLFTKIHDIASNSSYSLLS